MRLIKAPNKYEHDKLCLFLAGSTKMDKAKDWRSYVAQKLSSLDITILNPIRDDWGPSWGQSIKDEKFREQVEWELDAMHNADIILFYFAPSTKSPISLMELGLHIEDNIVVCCPDGYWRKGNVDIVCERYGACIFTDLDLAIREVRRRIKIQNSYEM